MNGLNVGLEEFKNLKIADQMIILYQNTEDLKDMVKAYRFQQKVIYTLISFLSIGVGYIFTMHLK